MFLHNLHLDLSIIQELEENRIKEFLSEVVVGSRGWYFAVKSQLRRKTISRKWAHRVYAVASNPSAAMPDHGAPSTGSPTLMISSSDMIRSGLPDAEIRGNAGKPSSPYQCGLLLYCQLLTPNPSLFCPLARLNLIKPGVIPPRVYSALVFLFIP